VKETERQDQTARPVKLLSNPTGAVELQDRLRVGKGVEGSLCVGFGKVLRILWEKLLALMSLIPSWKKTLAEADKTRAEADQIRAETARTEAETEIIGPKSDAELAAQWGQVYADREKRVRDRLNARLDLMRKVLEFGSPDHPNLPPEVVMELLNKLFRTLDDGCETEDMGRILG